jgi:alcohol dehydrogenase (cytochrome c)
MATVDAHLVALDARTGTVLWDKTVEDYKKGYYMTLAPLVARGKVMVGVSGGEYGIRGFVRALHRLRGSACRPTQRRWSGRAADKSTWRGAPDGGAGCPQKPYSN